jgi:hypothetical protein
MHPASSHNALVRGSRGDPATTGNERTSYAATGSRRRAGARRVLVGSTRSRRN